MKTIYQAIALGAVAFFSIAPVYAENTLRLQDVIQSTLQNNPQLAGYEFHLKALQGEQETAALKPALHANAQVENIAGSGDFNGADAAEFTLSLSSVIELGGKNDARVGLVTARQQQLASQQRVLTLDILTQATQAFIALASTQEQLKLLQQTYTSTQENVRSLEKYWAAGRTPEADLLRAKAALVRTSIELQKKQQELNSERIKLSIFWTKNNFAKPEFTQVEADLFTLPPLASLDTLIHQLDKNPDLAALSDQIDVRAAELRQAKSEREANINWNAGIRRLQISNDSAFVVGMSIPLASENRASGAITTANANRTSAELEHDAARTQLHAHLTNLHSTYEQTLAEVNSLRKDALPLVNQAMRATANGFNQGRYSYLELNLAQRELLDLQLALIDAATRAHILATEIERITGIALNATESKAVTAEAQQ